MQKLFRFELAFEGEPQDVGFLQGLTDVGLWSVVESDLYAQFEALPAIELQHEGHISFWFTEAGLDRFDDAIDRVIDEIAEAGWNLIGAIIQEDLANAIYKDEYQAAFPYELVAGRGEYVEVTDITEFKERN